MTRKRNTRIRSLGLVPFCLLLLGFLIYSPRTLAQDEDSTPSQQDDSSAASQPDSSSQSSPADTPWDPFAGQSTTSSLDTGQTIADANSSRVSPLQWGHLSLIAGDIFYGYDSNYKFSTEKPESSDALAARLLALYSIGTQSTSFDFQYRPSVITSTTGSEADVIGSALNIHTFHRINSRWMLSVLDRFSYAPDRDRFIDETLSPNFSSGDIQEESFLLNGFNELRENASGVLAYRLSFHDTLAFHAQYEFAELTDAFTTANTPENKFNTTNTVGGGISWTHAFNSYHEIGATYNYDREFVAGIPGSSQIQSWLLTYGQWIQPTLRLRVEVGPSLAAYQDNRPAYMTVRGAVSVVKMFHESRLAAEYSRDYNYVGVISSSFHDRVDAFYSRSFGPRWEFTGGGGYVLADSATNSQVRGRNLWVRVKRNLNPNWGLFASFANAAAGEPTASRNFATVGVHWSPQPQE